MSRLRWPDSTNSVSEKPGTIQIFGLTQQLRRSAVSVPANVAEGFKKRGKNDKARFFNIAQGSLEETRYYLRFLSRICG